MWERVPRGDKFALKRPEADPEDGMDDNRVVIRGGQVVMPSGTKQLDIIAVGGRISALTESADEATRDSEVIDASGMMVLPGAVDTHTHFIQDDTEIYEPDPVWNEGFAGGGRGAAAGGVTTVVEMPISQPVTADGATFARKRLLAERDAIVDFALWGGVVQDQEPDDIRDQIQAGAVSFKAFMCESDAQLHGVDDQRLMDVLYLLKDSPCMLAVHAENDSLLQAGLSRMAREGRTDAKAHAESRPAIVEIEAVSRAILFAEHTGGWIHIVHMSAAGSGRLVAAAKARGVRVTCETCPQYLTFDEEDLVRLGPIARCAPPFRSRSDVEQIWEQLANGTIDCVTTDHGGATYESRLHENVFDVSPGIPVIETFVPVFVSEARARGFSWERIAQLISDTPARLWNLSPRKGRIEVGSDADVMIIDPNDPWKIEGAKLHHTNKWTPWEGAEVTVRVVRTLLRGQTVFAKGDDHGDTLAPAGTGEFLRPDATADAEHSMAARQ